MTNLQNNQWSLLVKIDPLIHIDLRKCQEINTTNFSFHSSFCRKCSASNRILSAKDHASVQINVAEVDESTGRDSQTSGVTTYA